LKYLQKAKQHTLVCRLVVHTKAINTDINSVVR
jgi:hypothetical protein